MRLIKICEYDELSNPAKLVAISNLRDEYINHIKVCDWKDVRRTKKKYEKLFGVYVDIRESESSQGYYWFDYKDRTNSDGENDYSIWSRKKEESLNGGTDTWSDDVFCDVLRKYKWNEYRSFGYNVSELFLAFIEEVNNVIGENAGKTEDGDVANYIVDSECEFYENGKLYKE